MKKSEGFNILGLVSELREIYNELSCICGCRGAYDYIMNYLIFRLSEDTGMRLVYSLPELKNAEAILAKIHGALKNDRYDFSKAEVNSLLGCVYENILDKAERKKLGLFYTPGKIIDTILKKSLGLADILGKPFLKVLDPACGSGNFLLLTYDILWEKFVSNSEQLRVKYADESFIIETEGKHTTLKGREYFKKENLHYHIIKNCIYGADIDGFGVFLTTNSLALKGTGSSCCKPNIVVCNSLIKWEEQMEADKSGLGWFWNNKFDYIIGNPPWISLSRKQKKAVPSDLMEYYRSNYKGNSYLPNLYEYFIMRSLELLSKGGSLAFVIPDRFARNQQFMEFRKYILKNYNIRYIMFDIKFDGVVADSMAVVIENSFLPHNRPEIDTCNGKSSCEQKELLESWESQFMVYSCEHQKNDFEGIWTDSLCLKDIAHSFTGFISKKGKLTSNRTGERQTTVVKGANVFRYAIKGNWFYDISPENIIGGTRDNRTLTAKNKILVRKTGKKLIAALDTEGLAAEQSLYGIIIRNENFRLKYVLAVLNSSLMEKYYLNFLVTNINSTPQIKKKDLDQIPIKNCPLERQLQIEEMVNSQIRDYSNSLQDEMDRLILKIYGQGL
ncbi:MAG: TaqI-like C-terminal specificity domain-containing protein [Clostridiaceae bacterium]